MLVGLTCRQFLEWADYYARSMGEPGKPDERVGNWVTNPRAMEMMMRMRDQGRRKNG